MPTINELSLEFDEDSNDSIIVSNYGSGRIRVSARDILKRIQGPMPDATHNSEPLPLGLRLLARSGATFCMVIEHPPGIRYVTYRPGNKNSIQQEFSITTPWTVLVVDGLAANQTYTVGNVYVYSRPSQMTADDTALYRYELPNVGEEGGACIGATLPIYNTIGEVASGVVASFWMRRYNDEIGQSQPAANILRGYEGLSYEEACKKIATRRRYDSIFGHCAYQRNTNTGPWANTHRSPLSSQLQSLVTSR